MLKMVLAAIGIIATMAAAQTSAIWNGTADTDWYDLAPKIQRKFTITTAEQLAGLARLVNGGNDFSHYTVTLGANIMLNDTTGWQDWGNNPPANSWVTIGYWMTIPFEGTFDGNGFVVSGVYINNESRSILGLFGVTNGRGVVKNLGVIASFVRAFGQAGGLVARNNGRIENCYAIANAIITSDWNVGVLASLNFGTIVNSYAMGSATGRSSGTLVGTTHGTIRNSYAVGGDRLATPAGSGGSITINSHHLTTPAEQSTFVDWDFDNVWGINPNINNGYPYLRYFVDVAVDWSEQNTFTFNGEEQVPTATARFASGREVAIKISGGEINAGTYTATAELEMPNPNIILLNATKEFTINRARPAPRLIIHNVMAGTPLSMSVTENIGNGEVTYLYSTAENGEYSEITQEAPTEVGDYWAKAIIAETPNSFEAITPVTRFSISNVPIIIVPVQWSEQTEFIYNGSEQGLTATVEGYEILIRGNKETNAGNYTATVELNPFIPNVNLQNNVRTFNIAPRRVSVEWDNETPYTYNRSPQAPTPSAHFYRDDERINLDVSLVGMPPANAGKYRANADFTTQEMRVLGNIILENDTTSFEILRAPLTARLRRSGERIDKDSGGLSEEKLIEILISSLEFFGFVENDEGRDDERDLELVIQREDVSRSLRSSQTFDVGEHIVSISNKADNYAMSLVESMSLVERLLQITISERFLFFEEYPRATAISDAKKSDNRYGIKFAKNPVSEKAEINVMLPNNERATETKIVIYDMTGNAVFASTGSATGTVWDLRNSAGRIVANGTYLVIVEVKGASGKIYAYSARLGVKR